MRSLSAILACVLALSATVSAARAETIVFTGSATGFVEVFETAQTAVQFYGANNFPPVPVNANGANFFFHRDTNTGVFSLGLIVDQRGDGTRGTFNGSITGLPAAAFVARSDDAGELTMSGPGTAVFTYSFVSCCTDGGVISGLDPNNLNFNINVSSATGLTDTYLVGPTGPISLGIAPGAGVAFAVAAAPEPSSWALFILGFAGIASALKRQRRSTCRHKFKVA